MAERWSSQQNLQFLKLYKKEETLWNPYNPNYKNRYFRFACLQRIANELKLETVTEVAKKIKNLRSTYNQEIIKITKSKQSGSGADEEYKPTLKWFDLMDSIIKTINPNDNTTTSNLPNITAHGPAEDNQKIPEHGRNVECDTTRILKPKMPTIKPLHKINLTTQQNTIKNAIDEFNKLNSSLAKPPSVQQEDECDLIGKHIAYQLRQMPLLDMMDARDEIQQIISAYRKKRIYSDSVATYQSI